jgi:hypothetical protein
MPFRIRATATFHGNRLFVPVFEAYAVRSIVSDPNFDRVSVAHHFPIAQAHVHPTFSDCRLNFDITFVPVRCAVGIAGRLALRSDRDSRRMTFPSQIEVAIECLTVPDSRHFSDHACPLHAARFANGELVIIGNIIKWTFGNTAGCSFPRGHPKKSAPGFIQDVLDSSDR